MMASLDGKVAIVTGGNSGIGEATVRLMAHEGAKVAILARREPEGLAVQQAVGDAGGDATFIACDVTERAAIESAVARTVETYGALHVVFNNAGGGGPNVFPQPDDQDWEYVLRLNLTSTYVMMQAAWPHLIAAGGGSIVNMSSFAAVGGTSPEQKKLLPFVPGAAYGAAKAGVEALTRFTASEGAPHNIRVNAVRPGQIVTPVATRYTKGRHFAERYFSQVQLTPGPGTADDVANLVCFLASDAARFINAQIINIDGGAAAKV